MLKQICIEDDIEFNTEVDVLNECFNKGYEGYQRGFCHVNYAKTVGAWFPQIAIDENGKLIPQSASKKQMVNTISEDGMRIEMYSLADVEFGHGNELHFTFAKYKGKGFKYVGTFIRDSLTSTDKKVCFIRVSDHINLRSWVNDTYTEIVETSTKDLMGEYGDWTIQNTQLAIYRINEGSTIDAIKINREVNWFFHVDRLEWADYLPCPILYQDNQYIAKIKYVDDNAAIILDNTLVEHIKETDAFETEMVLLCFMTDKETDGFALSIQGVGQPKNTNKNSTQRKSEQNIEETNFLECRVNEVDSNLDELNLYGEEREAVVKIRVNQGEFREQLLNRYNHCCICKVSNPSLLRASHIKPWSVSENNEKLDVDNGFLFCPNHDLLFDKGYISFDNEGRIMISAELQKNDMIFMNVREDMQIELTVGNKQFLDYHRNNIFRY